MIGLEFREVASSISLMIGHRPVIVKRVVIGSNGGWMLSALFKL